MLKTERATDEEELKGTVSLNPLPTGVSLIERQSGHQRRADKRVDDLLGDAEAEKKEEKLTARPPRGCVGELLGDEEAEKKAEEEEEAEVSTFRCQSCHPF